jgi:ferredoxin
MPGEADAGRRADLESAIEALDRVAGSRAALHAKACVRCGLCGQSCHVYLAEPMPANLPAALSGVALAAANGKLYAFGGSDDNGFSNTTFEYDPASDTWTARASMPGGGRGYASAAALGTLLVLVADFSAFLLVLAVGMAYLFVQHDLKAYEVVAAVLLVLMTAGLAGVMLLTVLYFAFGLPLAFMRAYNSVLNYDGPLGHRWTHSYNWLLTASNTVFAGATNSWKVVQTGEGRQFSFKVLDGDVFQSPADNG